MDRIHGNLVPGAAQSEIEHTGAGADAAQGDFIEEFRQDRPVEVNLGGLRITGKTKSGLQHTQQGSGSPGLGRAGHRVEGRPAAWTTW